MPTPKRTTITLLVAALLLAVGCGSAEPMGAELDPVPTVDAAATVDVAASKVDAAAPEAASPDSAPEAAAPVPDATADAGLDVARAEATAPEAAASPDADAQAATEASKPDAAPKQDAAAEAEAAAVDAAPTSDGGRPTVAEVIARTFPEGCSADGIRKCGGVKPAADGIVETWPLSCYRGAWILAGGYECSRGCGAAGVLCDP